MVYKITKRGLTYQAEQIGGDDYFATDHWRNFQTELKRRLDNGANAQVDRRTPKGRENADQKAGARPT